DEPPPDEPPPDDPPDDAPDEAPELMPLLAPDDAADVIQCAPTDHRAKLISLLDDATRIDVNALLAYAEDEAGGLMNPRYARLRPEMSVDEAIKYLRRLAREHAEVVYYAYVLDAQHHLVGVVSFRELIMSAPEKRVRDMMRTELISVPDDMDQEAVSHLFAQQNLLCIPVVDAEGRMKGIVTADDIVDVVKEEATEDIQKLGGLAALDAPYTQSTIFEMLKKRLGWLAMLFVGETFTATAIGFFEDKIKTVTFLASFIPLIISSGGNSGSQSCTLVIRAMALGEVRLRDWWWVMRREVATGLIMGICLCGLALVRVAAWEWGHLAIWKKPLYGEHYMLVGAAIGISVMGNVIWGTTVGSLLPFALRRCGLDPASASAPFVATFVDITGIVVYFYAATVLLSGTLL
ncbi:MAG: magnesium transporter, partial [Phycisphaerales bacterium]|nr:magnesium transporter [Phycisphaerales bacterium]